MKGKEIVDRDAMRQCYMNACEEYYRANEGRVEHIMIFRDGVGDAMRDQVINEEVLILNDVIKEKFPGALPKPKITLIVVNKRINQRFFEQNVQNAPQNNRSTVPVKNPPCGTIVDMNLVCNESGSLYDFFLISQTATQGCILPTHFFVCYDTSDIDRVVLQDLTYQLCYFYYNWGGSIKVPAPCQYAHKVCKYALDI